MKQNNLLLASTKRASSADELDYLHHLLREAASPRKRLLKAILNFFVLWGALLLGLLFASGVLSYLATGNELLTSILSFSGLREVAIVISASFALLSTYRWLKAWENPYPDILQDINDKKVIVETYVVQDMCRFQEPELGGFIYFLKVSEQAVFVIYDYQSQTENDAVFLVKRNMQLSLAPHCKKQLGQEWQGDDIFVSATYPLTLPPENWPQPETWLSVEWSQLPSFFSE